MARQNKSLDRTIVSSRVLSSLSAALSALLLSCGLSGDTLVETKSQLQSESLYGENAETAGARFMVEIKGGEYAGTYQLESFDPRPCQIGMLGVNLFSVNASGKPPSLIYAEVFISDFREGGGETDVFSLLARTPEFDFQMDTRPGAFLPGGRGTASYVDDGADSIRIRIRAWSEEGVEAEAEVECFRAGRLARRTDGSASPD